jgi:hypothetical protein
MSVLPPVLFGCPGEAPVGPLSRPSPFRQTPNVTTAGVGFLAVVCGDRTQVGVALWSREEAE